MIKMGGKAMLKLILGVFFVSFQSVCVAQVNSISDAEIINKVLHNSNRLVLDTLESPDTLNKLEAELIQEKLDLLKIKLELLEEQKMLHEEEQHEENQSSSHLIDSTTRGILSEAETKEENYRHQVRELRLKRKASQFLVGER